VELEGVFVQIGSGAQHRVAPGHAGVVQHGEIVVDAKGQTSLPGVFAAGDATTVPFKQIVVAAGEGAKAALGAFDHLMRLPAPSAAKQEAPALA
jgi:NADH-dependent peroxiredoxin subunit F